MDETSAALDQFWSQVEKECKTLSISDLKRHEFPIARIKKIMKLDEDVEKISVEAPFLLEKACELLVMELTMRQSGQRGLLVVKRMLRSLAGHYRT